MFWTVFHLPINPNQAVVPDALSLVDIKHHNLPIEDELHGILSVRFCLVMFCFVFLCVLLYSCLRYFFLSFLRVDYQEVLHVIPVSIEVCDNKLKPLDLNTYRHGFQRFLYQHASAGLVFTSEMLSNFQSGGGQFFVLGPDPVHLHQVIASASKSSSAINAVVLPAPTYSNYLTRIVGTIPVQICFN